RRRRSGVARGRLRGGGGRHPVRGQHVDRGHHAGAQRGQRGEGERAPGLRAGALRRVGGAAAAAGDGGAVRRAGGAPVAGGDRAGRARGVLVGHVRPGAGPGSGGAPAGGRPPGGVAAHPGGAVRLGRGPHAGAAGGGAAAVDEHGRGGGGRVPAAGRRVAHRACAGARPAGAGGRRGRGVRHVRPQRSRGRSGAGRGPVRQAGVRDHSSLIPPRRERVRQRGRGRGSTLLSVQRWRGLEQIPGGWGRCVVTIGVFDGVHRGHQQLINHAVQQARRRNLPCVLMTFDPHPSEVVRPGSHPAQLTTLRRRAELVEQLGVDVFCVLPFTRAGSRIPAEEFVHEFLVERLHAAEVVVGENFTFGYKAAGNIDLLTKLGERFGFEVSSDALVSGPVRRAGDPTETSVTFSSTYVRSCIDAGDVGAAASALGRFHRLEGIVVRGAGRGGKELGFPTANLSTPEHAAIPADGVYACWFTHRRQNSELP